MKFGIFDHLDDSGLPLAEHLQARLAMVEAYEAAGFHCYHVAEHHGTPLGYAPSPGLLFAALSQRTSRILFGPLVYLLPLYHPLRLIEEVAMLDQLSGGRFQLGIGRGVSPIEMGFYGIDMDEQQGRYAETLAILKQGLAHDRLTFEGRYFQFRDVPIVQRPLQQPHPPLWYGTGTPASVERCAREGINLVMLVGGPLLARLVTLYRETYAKAGGDPAAMPLIGVGRHVVLAKDEAEARALARPAWARWRANMSRLWDAHGVPFPLAAHMPLHWDEAEARGMGCAGGPAKVADWIAAQAESAGFTYFVAQLAFGDLPLNAVRRSAELFGAEVMPALATPAAMIPPAH